MKIIKYLFTSAIVLIVIFLFLVRFTVVTSSFECPGTITSEDETQSLTIYIKIEKYRWWVKLWADPDGDFTCEIPNETVDYTQHIIKVGDQFQILDFDKHIKGNFSTLSKTLALSSDKRFFDGVCESID